MEPCRSLALLAGSLGLASSLTALSTDYWIVATGPTFSAHSGLWPASHGTQVAGYIRVTQSFYILAVLWSLVSMAFLVLSCIPALSSPGRGPLVSTIMAFAAALSTVVAMAVYTGTRWSQTPSPQVQTFFAWSFYLGWVSSILFVCAGTTQPTSPGRTVLGAGAGQSRALTYLISFFSSLSTPGCLSLGAHCRTRRGEYETL
ncbi:protein NKG7 [Acomys russatus]|uniref:protein NKG7 n=1 Tax=Acomys russatus TaxID=60746 RepID=UPI0021E2AFEA|nr:protein NKG7 [Acomys russatus]